MASGSNPAAAREPDAASSARGPSLRALFAYGFRPFFLLAGVQAIAAMAVWLAALHGMAWPASGPDAIAWHAHEMIFGFVGAALSGFLLTAVASWTGQRGFAGLPLIVLVVLWLGGRIVMAPGLGVPPTLIAAIDLAFMPAVALAVAPSMIRAGNARNFPMLAFPAMLLIANLIFHLSRLGVRPEIDGVTLAVDAVLIMITLVGGRIVPAFTGNALRRRDPDAQVAAFGWVDRAAIAAVIVVLVVDVSLPASRVAGVVALAACVLHAWRLSRWSGWRTRETPIAWILHVAYAWIPIGLGLKGLWLVWQVPMASGWLHALTSGAFATMIVAVMTRASLGHTGRPLVVARPIVIAYVLLTLAAATRVLAPAIAPQMSMTSWTVAGSLWTAAFALYLVVYAPILCRPRADGKPG